MLGFGKKNQQALKHAVNNTEASFEHDEVQDLTPKDIMEAINGIQKQLDRLKLAITGQRNFVSDNEESVSSKVLQELDGKDGVVMKNTQEKVIEGVFDGQNMIGADGQQYDVPANYASKSKLVEGDILKLTINNIGAFLYKQIKPIDRMRLVGTLEQDSQNMQYFAVSGNKRWRLLTASVTYFHGEAGDEVVFFVPNEGMSRWAAVENIIQK